MRTVRAVLAALSLAGLAACSGGGDAAVDATASVPSSTVAAPTTATTAAPTTTVASTTTTVAVAPATTSPVGSTTTLPPELPTLADADGRVDVQWFDEGVRLLRRFDGADGAITAAIIDPSGRVAVVPASVGVIEEAVLGVQGLLVATRGGEVKQYSFVTREWTTVPFALPPNWRVSFQRAGDVTLLVGWDLDGAVNTGRGEARMAQLKADGTVTPASLPDDPWAVPTPGTMTVWTGSILGVYGVDSAAFAGGMRHAWGYDVATDTWRAFRDPAGLDCTTEECVWTAPHEFGYPHAVEWTGDRTFVHTFVGRNEVTALHDPVTDTWTALPAPPVDLVNPWSEVVGGKVVVFATAKFDTTRGFGQLAVLDAAAGSWSTSRLVPDDTLGADFSSTLCTTSMKAPGITVLGRCQYPDKAEPLVAIDHRTGAWAPVTADQARDWKRRQSPQLLADVLADRG